ncbi:invasion associated locus B family protein [Sphingomonas fuzhouensis]|uniref:invasion associated locus B family protein n=1 Tax=Sphingomonas fuzhouensis TaxID=3106033 RepID=UPI002AFF6579|nr:invasion associated locus B family protein [Sphingomonas sp. SGZ-02]
MSATKRRAMSGAGWEKAMAAALIASAAIPAVADASPPPSVPPVAIYGAWSVQCPNTTGRADYCQVAQRVEDSARAGRPILQVSLSCRDGQARCAIQLALPPNLVRGRGALLQLGATTPLELPVIDCDAVRCLAGAVLPLALGQEMARAPDIYVRFRDRIAGSQDIPLARQGLAAAFADMLGRNSAILAGGQTPHNTGRKDTMIPLLAAAALTSGAPTATPPQATAPAPSAPAAQPERYGDWSVLCVERAELPPCEVVQGVQRKEGDTQQLRFSFAYAGQGDRYGVQFQVPLGVLVQTAPLIRLDEKTDVPGFRITRCEPDGCFIDRVMTRAEIEPFFKATKGLIAVADRSGKPVVLPLSLNGFAQAMQVMTARNQAWAKARPAQPAATPTTPR